MQSERDHFSAGSAIRSPASPVRSVLFEKAAFACRGLFAVSIRSLADDEIADARTIYAESVDFTLVRIVSTFIANTPVALGNYVRVGLDGYISRPTLIHELAHIWQFQNRGTGYISDSVYHQLRSMFTTGSRLSAYQITDRDLDAESIHDLPAEKQAMVIENFYVDARARVDPRYRRFLDEVRSVRPKPAS